MHAGRVAHGERLSDLEDPDGRRGAVERDVGRDQQAGAPLVDAGREGGPADVPGAQLGYVGSASRRVRVGERHVADGGGQVGGGGGGEVRGVDLDGHLRGGGEHVG